jgi:hypothetical protein
MRGSGILLLWATGLQTLWRGEGVIPQRDSGLECI